MRGFLSIAANFWIVCKCPHRRFYPGVLAEGRLSDSFVAPELDPPSWLLAVAEGRSDSFPARDVTVLIYKVWFAGGGTNSRAITFLLKYGWCTVLRQFLLHSTVTQLCILFFIFFSMMIFHWIFFIVISPIRFFFLLYSLVTQLHIHVHILFSHMIMLHHKWLDVVLSATQQDLIANPFQKLESACINPELPIHLTPSPSPWQPQVYFPSP